jgi:hypothetical protein
MKPRFTTRKMTKKTNRLAAAADIRFSRSAKLPIWPRNFEEEEEEEGR